MRLIWHRPNCLRDLPYIRKGGARLNLIVILVPVLRAILIRQTLCLLGIGNPIRVYGVWALCVVLEHDLKRKEKQVSIVEQPT